MGQPIDYAYDNRDRLTSMLNANSQKLEYAYAPWGALNQEQWFTDAASTTALRTIAMSYDNNGNQTDLSDDGIQAGVLTSQSWDVLNRPDIKTVKYLPGGDRLLDTDYDAQGNIVQFGFDDAGEPFNQSHQYNALNRLTNATLPNNQAYAFTYYDNDDLNQITHPNSLTTDYSYQGNGPVAGIHVNDGASAIQALDYTYDAVLNIDTQTDNAGLHDFNYDGLYRLTESIRPSALNTLLGLPDEAFDYDLVGNRIESDSNTDFAYDGNHRMSQSPGLTYIYDDAGNTKTRSDGASFSFDQRNRMVQYAKDASTVDYVYTPDNLRLKKTVDGVTTWFLYANGQLLAEYDNAGVRSKRYAYLPGSYLAAQVTDGNGVYEVHGDHLQTPRALTDSAKNVVWESVHEGFGEAYVAGDVDGDLTEVEFNVGFPGQYRDSESGLVYNWNRYYDATTGRYITSDPIGLKGGVNTFLYSSGNPTRYSDHTGLAIWICFRALNGGLPGNHTYLWDDTKNRCCGRAPGVDPLKDCHEKGPKGDFCIKVSGSDGKEDGVIDCCSSRGKKGIYAPYFNDCVNTADDCLSAAGLDSPSPPGGKRHGKCNSCFRQ